MINILLSLKLRVWLWNRPPFENSVSIFSDIWSTLSAIRALLCSYCFIRFGSLLLKFSHVFFMQTKTLSSNEFFCSQPSLMVLQATSFFRHIFHSCIIPSPQVHWLLLILVSLFIAILRWDRLAPKNVCIGIRTVVTTRASSTTLCLCIYLSRLLDIIQVILGDNASGRSRVGGCYVARSSIACNAKGISEYGSSPSPLECEKEISGWQTRFRKTTFRVARLY